MDPTNATPKLLLNDYHVNVKHNGQEMVANEIRQKYFLIRVQKAIRCTWANCLKCRFLRARPLESEMGPLPAPRVNRPLRPFLETCIEPFGVHSQF